MPFIPTLRMQKQMELSWVCDQSDLQKLVQGQATKLQRTPVLGKNKNINKKTNKQRETKQNGVVLLTKKRAQWLRSHTVLAEDLRWIPCTHTGSCNNTCNSSYRKSNALFWSFRVPHFHPHPSGEKHIYCF